MNTVSKNAEKLCRGKWAKSTDIWNSSQLSDLTCVEAASASSKTIQINATQLAWKTLVAKWVDVKMNNNFTSSSDPINLFIDKWNLYITNNEITNTWDDLTSFDSYWYITTSCPDDNCAKATYLKWNFIINGLFLAGDTGTGTFTNRMYMHWKFISYNTLTLPTPDRLRTINNILWSTVYNNDDYPGISLMKLFDWKCDVVEWIGSDWTRCAWEASSTNNDSQLVDKAFWLIDMNIDSILTSN